MLGRALSIIGSSLDFLLPSGSRKVRFRGCTTSSEDESSCTVDLRLRTITSSELDCDTYGGCLPGVFGLGVVGF